MTFGALGCQVQDTPANPPADLDGRGIYFKYKIIRILPTQGLKIKVFSTFRHAAKSLLQPRQCHG